MRCTNNTRKQSNTANSSDTRSNENTQFHLKKSNKHPTKTC